MKKKTKNIITSIIGMLMVLGTLLDFFIFDTLDLFSFIVIILLGWIFIGTYNKLILRIINVTIKIIKKKFKL